VIDSARSDRRLLRMADADNVLIVIASIPAGEAMLIDGASVRADATLPLGFKVAAVDLATGDIAVRYGTPIGRVTSPIRRGSLVHTHNLESLYIRTHARGEA
jgi:SAF domain